MFAADLFMCQAASAMVCRGEQLADCGHIRVNFLSSSESAAYFYLVQHRLSQR
mgnify:FL=1